VTRNSVLDRDRSDKVRRSSRARTVRSPYSRPRLQTLGNIRDVTLGGSAGFGDSGGSFVEKPAFF